MYIPLPMTSPLQKGQVNGPAQIESPNSMTNPLSFLCPLHSGRTRILNRFCHNTG